MKSRLHDFTSRRFVRFLFTGAVAATVNVVSRYFLSTFISFRWAVAIAYLIGMSVAWLLARLLVFERSGRHWSSEFARFGLVNILAAAQVWFVSVGLEEQLFPYFGYQFHAAEAAHVIGVAFPILTSYLGHKHFSFSKHSQ